MTEMATIKVEMRGPAVKEPVHVLKSDLAIYRIARVLREKGLGLAGQQSI